MYAEIITELKLLTSKYSIKSLVNKLLSNKITTKMRGE